MWLKNNYFLSPLPPSPRAHLLLSSQHFNETRLISQAIHFWAGKGHLALVSQAKKPLTSSNIVNVLINHYGYRVLGGINTCGIECQGSVLACMHSSVNLCRQSGGLGKSLYLFRKHWEGLCSSNNTGESCHSAKLRIKIIVLTGAPIKVLKPNCRETSLFEKVLSFS